LCIAAKLKAIELNIELGFSNAICANEGWLTFRPLLSNPNPKKLFLYFKFYGSANIFL